MTTISVLQALVTNFSNGFLGNLTSLMCLPADMQITQLIYVYGVLTLISKLSRITDFLRNTLVLSCGYMILQEQPSWIIVHIIIMRRKRFSPLFHLYLILWKCTIIFWNIIVLRHSKSVHNISTFNSIRACVLETQIFRLRTANMIFVCLTIIYYSILLRTTNTSRNQ